MKITVYTIKDCAFSKQEKEYLNTNKLTFEEKDLETNKDFLTEMLAISNNFAGTPVTRVEKDDGTIAVLKGFTREEFDTTFGFAPAQVSTDSPITDKPIPDSTVPPAVNDTPISPPPQTVAEVPPVMPTEVTSPDPAVVNPQPVNPLTNESDPLKSVMDDLQTKAETTVSPVPPITEQPITDLTGSTDSAASPQVDPAAPTIPDFPAK